MQDGVEYAYDRRRRLRQPNVLAELLTNKKLWAVVLGIAFVKAFFYYVNLYKDLIKGFFVTNAFEITLLVIGAFLVWAYNKRIRKMIIAFLSKENKLRYEMLSKIWIGAGLLFLWISWLFLYLKY